MSYQEKRIYVSLITAFIAMGIYCYYMYDYYLAGEFNGQGANALVGQSTFWLIGGSIIVSIIAQILFSIIYAIINPDNSKADYLSDERDKQIELKGMQLILVAFSIGMVVCMGFLAYGSVAYMVFVGIILSMFVANILGDVAKLYFYRQGF